MRWIGMMLVALVTVTVMAFPSLDRLQSRAEDAIPPGWVPSDVSRAGGVPVVGPRANVTITAAPGPDSTTSKALSWVCPGTVAEVSPGGGVTHCSSLTMDVQAVVVAGRDARLTVTAYRRSSWLLIPAFSVALLMGIAWWARKP